MLPLFLLFDAARTQLVIAHGGDIVARPRVCLSVIVRDEERVIDRFVLANRWAFDRIDITDTGSRDSTVERARAALKTNGVVGAVHHTKWEDDFAAARNYALDRSRAAQCGFIAYLDVDEEVRLHPGDRVLRDANEHERFVNAVSQFCTNVCQLELHSAGARIVWWRGFAMNAARPWRFEGARHETVNSQGVPTIGMTGYKIFAWRDQSRLSRAPDALKRDGEALERDIAKGIALPRSYFYAGQSFDQAGDLDRALTNYQRRVERLDGWAQERYVAQLRMAQIIEKLNGFSFAITDYFEAVGIDGSRAEALHALAYGFRMKKNYFACVALSSEGRRKRLMPEHLFADPEVYEWKLLDEAMVCASYIPEYHVVSLGYSMQLIKLRPNDTRIADAFRWINNTLTKEFNANALPSAEARKRLLGYWNKMKMRKQGP